MRQPLAALPTCIRRWRCSRRCRCFTLVSRASALPCTAGSGGAAGCGDDPSFHRVLCCLYWKGVPLDSSSAAVA